MSSVSRVLLVFFGSVLGALVVTACTSAATSPVAPAAAEPPVNQVAAGIGERTIVGAAYAPQHITVPVGSTVTWTVASHEPHTVTFFAASQARPEGNSRQWLATVKLDATTPVEGALLLHTGVLNKDQKVSFSFPKEGAFTYYCPIHEGMYGSVTVVPPGQSYTTVAQAQAMAKQESDDMLALVEPFRQATLERATKKTLAEGSTEWTVINGPVMPTKGGYLQLKEYVPATLQIKKGDTVRWQFESGHSVTFLPPGERLAATAPPFTKPSAEYDGKSLYTSAIFEPHGKEYPTFDLKFPSGGSFPYLCQRHWERLGHVGVINVQ